jgi:hypothetical protein
VERKASHVPVFVDNTEFVEGTEMTRFTYFYVECGEPQATSYLAGGDALPILLVDLEGVIVSGLGDKEFLDTPEAISELFDFIEQNTPYVVSTSYIWLPQKLLRDGIGRELSRGDVLRLYTPLFLRASEYVRREQAIRFDDIASDVRAVYFSEGETLAFKAWTDMTVERVRKRYYSQPELNLRSRHRRIE